MNIIMSPFYFHLKLLYFPFRYIYTNQFQLATVQFGLISLSLCIFSLGLSVGVVIAVGMLLFFQVSKYISFLVILLF